MTTLFAGTAMACEDLRTCALKHLRVLHGFLNGREDTKLRSDRDGQVLVQGVDCKRIRDSLRKNPQTGKTTYSTDR